MDRVLAFPSGLGQIAWKGKGFTGRRELKAQGLEPIQPRNGSFRGNQTGRGKGREEMKGSKNRGGVEGWVLLL